MKAIYSQLIVGFVFLFNTAFSQNQYNISQYMLHHSFLNPAAMSSNSNLNAAIFYRSQWVGLNGAPVTQGLSLNMPLKGEKNTVGLLVLHDKIGVNSSTQISAAYAYKLKINNKINLAFGLNALVNVVQSNYSSIQNDELYDPTISGNTQALLMPNFKYGMYLTGKKYYAGFAIPNLLENRIVSTNKGRTSFNGNNLHYYTQAGYLFDLKPKNKVGLSTLVKAASGAPMQFDLNAQYIYDDKIGVGVSYRTSKELVFMANYQISPKFKIGYAYDYNTSRLMKYSNGSHEIMIIFSQLSEKLPINFFNPRF